MHEAMLEKLKKNGRKKGVYFAYSCASQVSGAIVLWPSFSPRTASLLNNLEFPTIPSSYLYFQPNC
jgi:hypothetical protein